MPILNVDQAKKVFVVKRGVGKGWASIVNPLFYGDKVKADIEMQPLSAINKVFERLAHGNVPSRVVLDFSKQ